MPKIIIVQKNDTLAGCEIIKAGLGNAEVVVLKQITGKEIKFTNGDSATDDKDKLLVARPLNNAERAAFKKYDKMFVKSYANPKSNGMAILQRLADMGVNITEDISKKVSRADAANNGQLGGFKVSEAVSLFAKEKNAAACSGSGAISTEFTLTDFDKLERQTSGRCCPRSTNQGYIVLDSITTPQDTTPQDLALISHAVSFKGKTLGPKELCEHLEKSTGDKPKLFGNVPDHGMAFASEKGQFSAALPLSETRLAALMQARALSLPEGRVQLHHTCAKQVLAAEFGNETDLPTSIKDLFLDHTPLAARKVTAGSLRLFLPFMGSAPKGKSKCWHTDAEQKSSIKAEDYFLPHLERLFCSGSGENSELHSKSQSESALAIEVNHPSYKAKTIGMEVKSAHFHSLGSDVFLLELELAAKADMTLPEWLDFISFARRVRNLYDINEPDENGDEKTVSWRFGAGGAAHMLDDIRRYYNLENCEYLGDDRAFVFQSTILEGNPPVPGTGAAEALEIALERYSAVDGWGDGRFYSESVAREEFNAAAYSRFQDSGNTLMATAHSFGFMGFDERKASGFALEKIHHEHMPWIYRRMVVYAQLVRAQLNSYEQALDDLVRNIEGNKDDIRKLREKFSKFIHCTWRETVSSQVQGQELFALVTRQMGLKARIAKLSKDFEVLDMEETIAREAAAERRAEQAEARQKFFAFLIGLVAMVLTIFQVLGDERAIYFPLPFGFLKLPDQGSGSIANINYLILVGEIVAGAMVLYGLASFLSRPKETLAKGTSWIASKWPNRKK